MRGDLNNVEPGRDDHHLDCPEPSVWYRLAGGEMPLEQAQPFLEHVSGCDHCRSLLRDAVSDLHDETTTSETDLIARLDSASPQWQHKLARKLAAKSTPEAGTSSWRRSWGTAPRLAFVTGAFLLIAAAGYWIGFPLVQVELAQRLLAKAYSDRRTVELRMARAAHGEMTAERGASESLVDRPVTLITAEVLLAARPRPHSSDSRWLHAKGQADLLDGKYASAADSLERALQLSPKSPEILIDLATAEFQQGLLPEAYENLSKALALKPDDPVGLFNRAIVSEHQFLFHQALEDWQRYLQLDPDSNWSDEARKRFDAVRAKLEQHDRSHSEPLLSPSALVERARETAGRAEIDRRIEEYLHEAAAVWLPKAYPEASKAADPAARGALFFLADLSGQEHSDRWLADVLRGSSAANFPQAVAALAGAIQANDAGHYEVTVLQAARAESLFRASHNVGGALRAAFERTFAAHLNRQSVDCRDQAIAALTEAETYSYSWLQIQLRLETAVCSLLLGDIGEDQRNADRAAALALANGYRGLYLRALLFTSDDQRAMGDRKGGLQLVNTGLRLYWESQLPALRAFGLYTGVSSAAESADQPHLQVAVLREAAALIETDPDLLQRAMTHEALAHAATQARQFEIAERNYAEASRLFALAPRTGASRSDVLEIEIQTAQLETREKHFEEAISRLESIQAEIRSLSNTYLGRMFYSTLGELKLKMHLAAGAEQALYPALLLVQQGEASLSPGADRGHWTREAGPVYRALAEAALMQGRVQESLEIYEQYLGAVQQASSMGRALVDASRATSTAVRSVSFGSRLPLLARETVVAYGVLPDGVAIWVYDNRGVTARWIEGSPEDLRELASRFHDLAADPRSELSALRRDAQSLYHELLAPVEQSLEPGRTLIIETDGVLAQVPFEALLDGNGRYLIERWPMVYSLGRASDAGLQDAGSITPNSPALVVGSTASSPADGLIPLPDITAETDRVARWFPGARVLRGKDATLSAVKDEIPAAALFHFAGHSLLTPDRAGLMLAAADGTNDLPQLLDANVLGRVKLPNLQLVVLSACSTASGSGGSGGFSSVVEALLRAGVPHVVASRWAVDSIQARALVEEFYRSVLSGQSAADAIRSNSRKMLSDPRTVHPYYWSAFASYGRP